MLSRTLLPFDLRQPGFDCFYYWHQISVTWWVLPKRARISWKINTFFFTPETWMDVVSLLDSKNGTQSIRTAGTCIFTFKVIQKHNRSYWCSVPCERWLEVDRNAINNVWQADFSKHFIIRAFRHSWMTSSDIPNLLAAIVPADLVCGLEVKVHSSTPPQPKKRKEKQLWYPKYDHTVHYHNQPECLYWTVEGHYRLNVDISVPQDILGLKYFHLLLLHEADRHLFLVVGVDWAVGGGQQYFFFSQPS